MRIAYGARFARAAATFFGLAKTVARDWNPPLTHERIDLFVADRRIDIGRARRELGYEPERIEVRSILEDAYRYHRQQGHL